MDAEIEAVLDAVGSEPALEVAAANAALDVALQPTPARPNGAGATAEDLSLVLDVPVELAVEMGRATMTIRETLAIGRYGAKDGISLLMARERYMEARRAIAEGLSF